MPKGIPLSEEEQALRRREIFDAAVNLFLEKGFQETSVREIADAAGMGKSTLYDYFKNKDEIVVFVLEEETALLISQAQAIANRNLTVTERLRKIMENHIDFMQVNEKLLLRLSFEAQRMNIHSQEPIRVRRYEYQNLVQALIEEGIADGSFRKVDSLLAARLLINSLLSILFTTRPTGDPREMLDEAVGIFLNGINN